jgi:hypothetical protein
LSIYHRLLELYEKNRDSHKTPLEDFTTELLVGTLESSQELLDGFLQEVLMIKGECFTITSQKKYILDDEMNCIVDVVFENQNTICFLENKVNSGEGNGQLARYARLLENLHKASGKEVHLRYCTKYYDPKIIENIEFRQIRWPDIYQYLSQHQEKDRVKDYMDYLRRENMAGTEQFNFKDLITMTTINDTILKMDEILDLVKPKLTELFGKPYQYDYERLKQICKHGRYAMWTSPVFGNNGHSEVLLGFEFYHEIPERAPIVFIQCYCSKQNNKYPMFVTRVNKTSRFDFQLEEEHGFNVWFEKPLSDFLSHPKQKEEICQLFIDQLNRVDGFRNQSPELEWKDLEVTVS